MTENPLPPHVRDPVVVISFADERDQVRSAIIFIERRCSVRHRKSRC